NRNISSIQFDDRILILLNSSTLQVHARKDPSRFRIAENVRLAPGRVGTLLTDWTRAPSNICANLKFARKQVLQSAFIHDDDHNVNGLTADLRSDTCAADTHRASCTPAPSSPPGRNPSAMPSTNSQRARNQTWD